MNRQKLIKLIGIFILLVSLFGIAGGVSGIIDAISAKADAYAENAEAETKLLEIENKSAELEAEKVQYKSIKQYLENHKSEYESNKTAYDLLKDSYDAKAAEFEAAKIAGELSDADIADTQRILDDGAVSLKDAKVKLKEYETAQAYVTNYEAEKTAVDTGLTQLAQSKASIEKITAGMEPCEAVKEALSEKSTEETKAFYTKLCLCAAALLAAVLMLFASIAIFRLSEGQNSAEDKRAVALLIGSLLFSFSACFYGVTSGFISCVLLMAALAAESAVAVAFLLVFDKLQKSKSSV